MIISKMWIWSGHFLLSPSQIDFPTFLHWIPPFSCLRIILAILHHSPPISSETLLYLLPYFLYESESEKKVKSLSYVWLFATLWAVAHQAPLPMGFSRREYWSGLPFPSPGDLPDPGIEPRSPALQADTLTSEPPGRFFLLLFYFVMFPKLYYDNFFTNVYPWIFPLKNISYEYKNMHLYQVQLWGFWFWATVVVQPLQVVSLCNPTDSSIPGLPVHHHLPEFA